MNYKWAVLECYLDGFIWTHHYTEKQLALWGIEDLQAAHAGRTYKLVELELS